MGVGLQIFNSSGSLIFESDTTKKFLKILGTVIITLNSGEETFKDITHPYFSYGYTPIVLGGPYIYGFIMLNSTTLRCFVQGRYTETGSSIQRDYTLYYGVF